MPSAIAHEPCDGRGCQGCDNTGDVCETCGRPGFIGRDERCEHPDHAGE